MDAKDLMIGCLIKTNSNSWYDESLKDKVCKVEHIGHNYLSCSLVEDPERQPYGEDKSFDPIPLTTEILEKNGFKKRGHHYGIYNDYYDIVVSEYNDGTWIVLYHCCEMQIPDEQLFASYVHQLQHFMRHCGIEKEIELTDNTVDAPDNIYAPDNYVPTGKHNTETEEAGDEEIQLPKKGKGPSVFLKLFWSFMTTFIGFGIIFFVCAAFGDEFDIQFETFKVAFGTCWFWFYCVMFSRRR